MRGWIQQPPAPAVKPGDKGRYVLHVRVAQHARLGRHVVAGLLELFPRARGAVPARLRQECVVGPHAHGVLGKGKGQDLPAAAGQPPGIQRRRHKVGQILLAEAQLDVGQEGVQGRDGADGGVLGNHGRKGHRQIGQLAIGQF